MSPSNVLWKKALPLIMAPFKNAGIEPDVRLPESDVICRLNASALSRILSNILSNAVKYSDGGFYVSLNADGGLQFKIRPPDWMRFRSATCSTGFIPLPAEVKPPVWDFPLQKP